MAGRASGASTTLTLPRSRAGGRGLPGPCPAVRRLAATAGVARPGKSQGDLLAGGVALIPEERDDLQHRLDISQQLLHPKPGVTTCLR